MIFRLFFFFFIYFVVGLSIFRCRSFRITISIHQTRERKIFSILKFTEFFVCAMEIKYSDIIRYTPLANPLLDVQNSHIHSSRKGGPFYATTARRNVDFFIYLFCMFFCYTFYFFIRVFFFFSPWRYIYVNPLRTIHEVEIGWQTIFREKVQVEDSPSYCNILILSIIDSWGKCWSYKNFSSIYFGIFQI